MPPSEQNSAPVSRPISNVPEYLHLDPIPDPQPPKSKKKLFALIAAIMFIVISAVGATGAWLYMSGEPERRLYGAIEGMMSVNYLVQKATTTFETKDEQVIETKYDLSNPAQAKSHSVFSVTSDRLALAGELVIPNSNEYYVQFTKLPEVAVSGDKLVLNQWYRVKKTNMNRAPELIRSINIERMTKPVFGNLVVGNFNADTISNMMSYIRNNGVYTYTNTTTNDENVVYSLSLDSKIIGEMNKTLAKQLDVSVPTMYDAMAKNKSYKTGYDLVLDKQTGKTLRITQLVDSDESKTSAVSTVTYAYPDSFSLVIPSDFKELAND